MYSKLRTNKKFKLSWNFFNRNRIHELQNHFRHNRRQWLKNWINECQNDFFYENINEKVYVKIFHDYIDKFKIYCRFRKILYDFKQSFYIWFNIFVTYFNEQNFLILNVDQNVFNNDRIIIVIYVNDLLFVDFDKKLIQKIKKVLHKRF